MLALTAREAHDFILKVDNYIYSLFPIIVNDAIFCFQWKNLIKLVKFYRIFQDQLFAESCYGLGKYTYAL